MDSETEHCINRFLADLITNTLMPNTIAKHSKPLVPASTSVKSMRHRIQVHLEIISSIKRMIFGVSMKNSPSHSGCIAAKNCFQVRTIFMSINKWLLLFSRIFIYTPRSVEFISNFFLTYFLGHDCSGGLSVNIA